MPAFVADVLLAEAAGHLPDAVDLRRRIHRHPELGLELPRTQAAVVNELFFLAGGTPGGVDVGITWSGAPSQRPAEPRIALRRLVEPGAAAASFPDPPSLSLAVPTGSVTFYDGHPAQGGTPLGGPQALDAGGRASESSAALAVGAHTIHVAFSGDANYTAAVAAVQAVVSDSTWSFRQ